MAKVKLEKYGTFRQRRKAEDDKLNFNVILYFSL